MEAHLIEMNNDYQRTFTTLSGPRTPAQRRPVVLIVDDEPSVLATLKILLKDHFKLLTARDGLEAIEVVKRKAVDLVLLDINLPSIDGLKTLRLIRDLDRGIGVIMISAMDSARKAVEAIRLGALDYITKPFEEEDLVKTLKKFTDTIVLRGEVDRVKEGLWDEYGYGEILSRSPRMRRVFELIHKVSPTSSSVLISGKSGTGKELVARAIHCMSPRKDKPFVAVNCGAVPSELMESELFGHERGSFTGAHATKIGKFEYADRGTIFLDEVSTLPLHLQIKLLRVLQEKSFERVGSNKQIKVNIRVIAATNVDLEEAVREGRFREDLYYRLKVVPIDIPPLSERKEDIPLLVEHFLEKHSKICGKRIKAVTSEVLSVLHDYHWPGNVRELENLVERLVVLARESGEITSEDLSHGFFTQDKSDMPQQEVEDFREACRFFERRYILNVLDRTNWNQVRAARVMKVHRNTLLMKMKELGIRELRPKPGRKPIDMKRN